MRREAVGTGGIKACKHSWRKSTLAQSLVFAPRKENGDSAWRLSELNLVTGFPRLNIEYLLEIWFT